MKVGSLLPATSSLGVGCTPGFLLEGGGVPKGLSMVGWALGAKVLTGPCDHTVLVRQGTLHQGLTVLVATAYVAVQGQGWGEGSTGPSVWAEGWGPGLGLAQCLAAY